MALVPPPSVPQADSEFNQNQSSVEDHNSSNSWVQKMSWDWPAVLHAPEQEEEHTVAWDRAGKETPPPPQSVDALPP